jgi:hypothetical protein
MAYAVSLAEEKTFDEFYDGLYHFLRGTHVVRSALDNLSAGDQTAPGMMPSLIRSAARVYASDPIFGDKRLDLLIDAGARSHLKDIVFNAVEFRGGVSFRFQTSRDGEGVVGNGNLRVSEAVARDVRLADIAAASSCFPSAFEPLRFPDDFRWPDRRTLEAARSDLAEGFGEASVPLMDGGIFDNQGIDSVRHVYSRGWNKDRAKPDLFIISDTSQRSESLMEFPPTERRGWLTLGKVSLLAWALLALALVSAGSLLYHGVEAWNDPDFERSRWALTYAVPFVFAISIAGGLYWLRGRVREGLESAEEKTAIKLWPYLKGLKVPELLELADSRVKSLITLSTSVFMKRIRDMGFADISVHPRYTGRTRSNLIYDLDDETRYGEEVRERGLKPSDDLRELARVTEAIDTNLWFTDEAGLRRLIACGQATACFNVMRFILRERKDKDAEARRVAGLNDANSPLRRVYDRADQLWRRLNDEGPMCLVDERPPRPPAR